MSFLSTVPSCYRKRNWNGGWDYQPDAIIKSMAKEPGQMGSYRYAAVLKNAVNDIVIKSATMRWEEFNTTKYAACQLYGPTRCVQNAPPASENMMRVWDGAVHLRAIITYRCYPGYFMDGSVTLTQQEFSCRGQLGGWVSAHYELFSCNILKVCSNESIQLSRGNMIVVTSSPNFLALNSTVTYICPPSMSMGKGVTAMNSTCVENSSEGQPGPPTFSFQPDDIPNCNVCIDDPNIANAISSWDRNTEYVINDRINLTCTSGFFFNDTADANTVKEILCTELGWFPGATDLMCRPGCTDPLPSAGPNMSIPELPQRDLGTELTYTCDQGLFVPAALPDAKSSVIITCLENSTWGMEPFKADDLHCVRMCMEKPVSPPAPGNTTWDRTPSQVGAKINLTCPAGYAFPNFSITIQLTCEEGGTWSEVGSREIFCRSYTNELPLAPTGTKYDGPPPPYWEGVVLNFTCAEGLVSKGELNTTSTTFNGTDWVPLELEFACFNVSKLEKKKVKTSKTS
ncbi:complement component receptor 1-like protein [Macrobrachium rosenbergii]|uniref:complement component receptor 1-like protein n=1 Tax=Macrobrachium rosenbergii TaxID=79674 RepID=UPI0034D608F1